MPMQNKIDSKKFENNIVKPGTINQVTLFWLRMTHFVIPKSYMLVVKDSISSFK